MSEKPRESLKRRVVFYLLLLCVCWLVYFEAKNLTAWDLARQMSIGHPDLGVVPTALVDTSIAELAGPRIEKFGFSFQVPWKDIEKDRNVNTGAALFFREGGALLVFDPANGTEEAKVFRGETSSQYGLLSRVLGPKALTSNYEFMAAKVHATPADVRWWARSEWNVRSAILLMNKGLSLGGATTIHPVEASGIRGFQFGDPDAAPFKVLLELFDASDRHYELVISGKDEDHPVISQAQINALVGSFRGIPTEVTSTRSNGE